MDCLKINKNNSLVRVFHAVPQAPSVDIYVNGEKVFDDIDFLEFTKYVNLPKGEYKIDVYESGTKVNPFISQTLSVPKSEIFTIAATGNLDDLSLLVIPDYISEKISDSYSTFRVIHLSPDSPAIDVLVDEELLFSDINFREGTDYVDVNPKKYKIEIVASGTDKLVLSVEVLLNSNRIYTLYIVDELEDLKAIQSVDGNTYVCR